MKYEDLINFIKTFKGKTNPVYLDQLALVAEKDIPKDLTLRNIMDDLAELKLNASQIKLIHQNAILLSMRDGIVAGMYFACAPNKNDSEFGVITA